MSDGHFNRSLLPKSELTTGIKTGKAQMRGKAEQAFRSLLDESPLSALPEKERERLFSLFRQRLNT